VGASRLKTAPVPRPPGALPGDAPPWFTLPPGLRREVTLDQVRAAFAGAPKPLGAARPRIVAPLELPPGRDVRPAGVLCLLFGDGPQASVVLTRRSPHLHSHAGEVSFPGGRLRPGELPLHAALREAEEEVGVDPSDVEVIGELTPLTTMRSPALVYCFVATFPGPGPGGKDLRAQWSEVEKVFWERLSALAGDGVFHEELWPVGGEGPLEGGAPAYRAVPFFTLEEDVVWGATARMLFELLSLTLDGGGAAGLGGGSLEGT